MKLLLCKKCQDIIRLIDVKRTCKCGKIGGRDIDDINAVYFGKMAVPIGFENGTLVKAVHNQPKNGMGKNFTAFVIPKICSTYKFILEEELK